MSMLILRPIVRRGIANTSVAFRDACNACIYARYGNILADYDNDDTYTYMEE